MSDYESLLRERFPEQSLNRQDRGLLGFLLELPREHGFESEMMEWLRENPGAGLQETAGFVAERIPPIEIVDDDELPEEERNTAID